MAKASDASAYNTESCIYCQLDDHPERDEEEEEEEDTIFELWMLVQDADTLEKLFDALSHCAGLHPSENGAESGDAHPFSGIAPFGTGADSDDNEEDADDAEETMLTWQQTPEPSNTLMFANLPPGFFASEELMEQLLHLLQSYGPMVEWTPLPAFGRGIAVFERDLDAARVKYALDHLLLLYEDEQVRVHTSDMPVRAKSSEDVLRVYFCVPTPLVLLPDGDYIVARSAEAHQQHLAPPAPEREFLISPPGSPPVGWEPREEDGPNKTTLAQDLIDALQKLVEEPGRDAAAQAEAAATTDPVVVVEPGDATHHFRQSRRR
ncbi:hypothetical protein MBRA1_001873 [Malassezia brasiliensis]|uniref:RRM domain-containing protein n=1 Tax=Malassezia brasiliensis TaxID=1821822 RepID=A0AAF0DT45_9BASI|nr:hypothetical protein MBRA1_001873 [Malassezia brasiliensis]